MKNNINYFAIIFVLVFTCLTASCRNQKEGAQITSESKEVIINVGELGKTIAVPTKEMEMPMPEEWSYYAQQWGSSEFTRAMTELSGYFNAPENTYIITSSPEPWITLALLEEMKPLNVLYLYPRPDGVVLDMCELKRVKTLPDYNYDVVFEIVEKGEEVFVNLNSDRAEDVEKKKGHTFDTDNLCKVSIPEIPAGKHVFVHGKGMYCVMVAVARSYIKGSKSVSLACRETDYTCAVSLTNERKIGDVRARTLPNNL